jgi:hypothetical protein
MKSLLKIFPLLALLCAPALAQQQQPSDQKARLVDSFGNIQLSDLKARLDNFAIELQNAPDSKGYIVTYPAANKFPGASFRRAYSSLEYMTMTRGLDAARISVVNGGFRDEATYELWVVHIGAELPVKPFDISLMMAGQKTPLLFDSFPVIERGDPEDSAYVDSEGFYPDAVGLYDSFVDVLQHDPGLRGCIIAYAMPRRRGTDREIASRVKLAIAKTHAVDLSRIIGVGGGKRKQKRVELWLVPPGAELPKPTPTVRAVRRKRR